MGMFDPFEVPQETTTSYSASSTPKALSDEEIALKLVEMFVRESKTRSIDNVVDHYFYVLDRLRNKTTASPEQTEEYSSQQEYGEEDILTDREYASEEDINSIQQAF